MGMELEDELEKLRGEVATWERRNPGAHLKRDIKDRLIAAASRAIERGATASHTAELLGVKPCRLSRWLRVGGAVTKIEGVLREMTVIGPDAPVSVPQTRPRAEVLEGRWPRVMLPGGIVVEGLDTEQVITLLRALR